MAGRGNCLIDRLITFHLLLTKNTNLYFEILFIAGDLMDILALINSGINFILYCSMSRQFRSTFNTMFRPKFLDRWLPVSQDEDNQFMRNDGRTDANCLTTQVTQV